MIDVILADSFICGFFWGVICTVVLAIFVFSR